MRWAFPIPLGGSSGGASGDDLNVRGDLNVGGDAAIVGSLLVGGNEIKAVDPAETFTGTRSNAISRGECFGTYNKHSKEVTLVYHFYNSSDIPMSYTLFTIPEEYRPTTSRYGGCFYTTSDPTYVSYQGYVTNGGIVRQGLSGKVRSGFGVIKYVLD